MIGDRMAGGLWCHEVLAGLSDYIDERLDASRRQKVEDHLLECDVCERFGGEFQAVVQSIRERLVVPEPLHADMELALHRSVFGDD